MQSAFHGDLDPALLLVLVRGPAHYASLRGGATGPVNLIFRESPAIFSRGLGALIT